MMYNDCHLQGRKRLDALRVCFVSSCYLICILLSFVNTKLRDEYRTLEEFCMENDLDVEALKKKLEDIGFQYNAKLKQFK